MMILFLSTKLTSGYILYIIRSFTTVLATILFAVLWGWYFGALVCIYVSICRPHPNYVLPKLTLIAVQLVLLVLAGIGIIIYFSGAAHDANNTILKIYEVGAIAVNIFLIR